MLREFVEFLVLLIFRITYKIIIKYYPGEPVHIHIQSFINTIQENNWTINTKKSKSKLPLFCGNRERIIPIYALW